jgi:hypothetical protein
MFEDYVDDHKENAFNSAFMEPARFYFVASKAKGYRRDNVDTHGNNWSLALLNATLQIHLVSGSAFFDVDFAVPRLQLLQPVH